MERSVPRTGTNATPGRNTETRTEGIATCPLTGPPPGRGGLQFRPPRRNTETRTEGIATFLSKERELHTPLWEQNLDETPRPELRGLRPTRVRYARPAHHPGRKRRNTETRTEGIATWYAPRMIRLRCDGTIRKYRHDETPRPELRGLRRAQQGGCLVPTRGCRDEETKHRDPN